MSLINDFEEGRVDSANNENMQHPEQQPEIREEASTQPPANEYWVRNSASQTTPSGFGQGHPQQSQTPYPGGYVPYNPVQQAPYPQAAPQPYRPAQYQYQTGGWQQPPQPPAQEVRPQENYQWNFQDYDKATDKKTKKKHNRGLVVFMVSIICLIAVGLISVSAYGVYNYVSDNQGFFDGEKSAEPETETSSTVEAKLEIASKPQISESPSIGGKMTIPQVAKAVLPSVVGVMQYRPDMYLEETGAGSGIVMTEDGYIVTNAHVVAGGTAFKVVLSDGTPKDADLIGFDTLTDLAVLKIVGLDDITLTPAVFGNSAEIEVGEQVIAIGNPAGAELAGSVTQGIVSAVNREIPVAINMPLIQTDAAINPGNSGGALVNEYGQVIGINSSKIVAEGFEGIGFAIPISEAKPVIDEIMKNGRVTGRVKLGITAKEIDEIDARKAGLKEGIRIIEIDPESDLVQKGIQKFDIITHIDGERIYTMTDLKKVLEAHKPGDRITISFFRQIGVTRSETFDAEIVLMED